MRWSFTFAFDASCGFVLLSHDDPLEKEMEEDKLYIPCAHTREAVARAGV